jgi:hypothetical protein
VARSSRSKLRQGRTTKADELKENLPPRPETDVIDSNWVEFKRYANSQDRGAGQYKAMNNWNALGYAAYMFHHKRPEHPELNLNQDCEWLHIRGAQNGGKTDRSNLVAGTSTTNSRMIPWEDKINAWSNDADPKHPLSVRFAGWRVPSTYLGLEIRISIAAEEGLPGFAGKVPKATPMLLIFHPLDGTVFDRVSERLTTKAIAEEALKAEGGVAVSRNYVINTGKYKGCFFHVHRDDGDRLHGVIEATGNEITIARPMLSVRTTELGSKLPPKKHLREDADKWPKPNKKLRKDE